MNDVISMPVNEIPDPDRRSLENLLGHPLAADQQVLVMVYSAAQTSDKSARRAAAERIRHTLDQIDRYRAAHGVSDDEVDAAVEEAMRHVRPRSN